MRTCNIRGCDNKASDSIAFDLEELGNLEHRPAEVWMCESCGEAYDRIQPDIYFSYEVRSAKETVVLEAWTTEVIA